MDDSARRLVSRAQLARYADVSRAAVSTWRKRHPDFPDLADSEAQVFDLDEIIEWLSSRAIPANARRPHEPVGATYADRVRDHLEDDVPSPDRSAPNRPEVDTTGIHSVVFRTLDDLRGTCTIAQSSLLIGALAFLRAENGKQWHVLLEQARQGAVDGTLFATEFGDLLPAFIANDFRPLGPEVFTMATQGVEAIDIRGGVRATMAATFESALSFLEKSEHPSDFEPLPTPGSVVGLMVKILASTDPFDSVYDPFCRTGEFLTEAVRARTGVTPSRPPRVSGATFNERAFGISSMNMLLHGIEADFGRPGLPWERSDTHDTADFILANPPFNMSGPPPGDSTRESFRYGKPPKENANFRWLQYVIDCLPPNGRAGVVMANGASSSSNAKETTIRSNMVEDGAVECVIALPDRLFQTTGIPVTLWFLRAPTGKCDEVLFIDATGLGRMTSRTVRTLQEEDGELIHRTYRAWRDNTSGHIGDEDTQISHVATIQEIRDNKFILRPSVYVTGRAPKVDQTEQSEKLKSLIRNLGSLESQTPRIDARCSWLLQEAQRWVP